MSKTLTLKLKHWFCCGYLTFSVVCVQGDSFDCVRRCRRRRVDRLLGLSLQQLVQLFADELEEGIGHRHAEVLYRQVWVKGTRLDVRKSVTR